MATCSAQDLLNDAAASGFVNLNDKERNAVLLQLLCELYTSGLGQNQTPWLSDIDAGNFNITNLGKINNVKVWRGLITQAGAAAPTAIVLENTLGGTITWAFVGTGNYTATLTGAWTANKTFLMMERTTWENTGSPPFAIQGRKIARANDDVLSLQSYSVSGSLSTTLANGIFLLTPLEIRVYP